MRLEYLLSREGFVTYFYLNVEGFMSTSFNFLIILIYPLHPMNAVKNENSSGLTVASLEV